MVSSISKDILKAEWDAQVPGLEVAPIARVVSQAGIDVTLLNSIALEVSRSELKTVFYGDRGCTTYHIRSDHMAEDLALLIENDLHFIPLKKCKRVDGFAHRFYEPDPNEPHDVFGVISKRKSTCWKFKKAFDVLNDRAMGELLGYPDCCIDFFEGVWPKIPDPIWLYALNGKPVRIDENTIRVEGFYPECNILPRYFGFRAVPHLVCSPKCKKSRDFSKIFLKQIEHSEELLDLLAQPMTWDNLKGLVVVKFSGCLGIANSVPYKERRMIRFDGSEKE